MWTLTSGVVANHYQQIFKNIQSLGASEFFTGELKLNTRRTYCNSWVDSKKTVVFFNFSVLCLEKTDELVVTDLAKPLGD